ncbi:3' terminal RNA ribose 2'-O-methyltransferase Hen1 [Kribbella sp. NBC_01245]|uniref:3' terminal RNA ribose 2'-O-methyltransferase Hen1 n=1 Tax=Kribbella sp. NBC_01245 TaxID=2903578 RepID=UPI002E2B52B9|nr:3' terminal RNA ribose 2'-O-methyltransferase Hen1 [Kribbella sp. NBC_01245]
MFLSLTTTSSGLGAPATDLGFLLHKNPGRPQSIDVAGGTAFVVYPEATDERCTAALLLEIDPIGLVRAGRGKATEGFTLGQYVNDRPYAASSLLAVALGKLFRTAMTGRCDARPELAAKPIDLEIHVPAVRGGAELVTALFAPLGWQVDARPVPLDPALGWDDARYVDLRLTGTIRLADALNHLYVLLPVLDDAKHYWVGSDEVDKLIRAGTGWLADHSEKAQISRRYLAHQGRLAASALERLEVSDSDAPLEEVGDESGVVPLATQRRTTVLEVLHEIGARRVADLGCGEGVLVAAMLADPAFVQVVATDVSSRSLTFAERRLNVAEMSDRQRERLRLFQSSVTYTDDRLEGLDAAVLMEVVEHVDPPRLPALAQAVFGAARFGAVIVTTPNAEYNVNYPALLGGYRHPDHRFEWTRAEFAAWTSEVAISYGYDVALRPVGPVSSMGAPTQLALFTRKEVAA